jgi:hypothetical protein
VWLAIVTVTVAPKVGLCGVLPISRTSRTPLASAVADLGRPWNAGESAAGITWMGGPAVEATVVGLGLGLGDKVANGVATGEGEGPAHAVTSINVTRRPDRVGAIIRT